LEQVSDPAVLNGSDQFFGTIGWAFLENKNYEKALAYLKRGMDLHPYSLMTEMNLAHANLFSGDVTAALKIYKAHFNGIVHPGTKNGRTS
jgi:tetratricopeptide (TPR) repeat protein